jgi:hypothetical protein
MAGDYQTEEQYVAAMRERALAEEYIEARMEAEAAHEGESVGTALTEFDATRSDLAKWKAIAEELAAALTHVERKKVKMGMKKQISPANFVALEDIIFPALAKFNAAKEG